MAGSIGIPCGPGWADPRMTALDRKIRRLIERSKVPLPEVSSVLRILAEDVDGAVFRLTPDVDVRSDGLPTVTVSSLIRDASIPPYEPGAASFMADFLEASADGGDVTPDGHIVLERPGSVFLDGLGILSSDAARGALYDAMESSGLMATRDAWRAWVSGGSGWSSTLHDSEADAAAVVHDMSDGPEGCAVTREQVMVLTVAGRDLLPGFPDDPAVGEEAMVLLVSRLISSNTGICGVMWGDPASADFETGHRFAILPEMLPEFLVTGPAGSMFFEEYARSCAAP